MVSSWPQKTEWVNHCASAGVEVVAGRRSNVIDKRKYHEVRVQKNNSNNTSNTPSREIQFIKKNTREDHRHVNRRESKEYICCIASIQSYVHCVLWLW